MHKKKEERRLTKTAEKKSTFPKDERAKSLHRWSSASASVVFM